MQITSTARPEWFEVKLKGRMDAGWSDHVARALDECLQSGQHTLALDMAEVDYISSAGVRILLVYARKLKSIQGSFSVIKASSSVRRILGLSGLGSLLLQAAPSSTVAETGPPSRALRLKEPGATAEVFELDPGATLSVRWPGNPEKWLEETGAQASPAAAAERGNRETCVSVEFPSNAIGIGLGGFGEQRSDSAPCLGEFLAAAGAAVCLASDGSNKPDYMLQEGDLTPSLNVAYGAIALGRLRQLLRFDKGPQKTGLPLSTVIEACLGANDGKGVGFVMVVEVAALIGACLQKMPADSGTPDGSSSLFAFPAVRDWLSFTVEPAFRNTTSLIVGFAATQGRAEGLRLLKPGVPSGAFQCHVHAAAFPYRPLSKGKVDLHRTVRALFENGQVLGLLHLLNDWREGNGAGESHFLRGACWWAPLLV